MITKTLFTAAFLFTMAFSALSQDKEQNQTKTSISDDELKVFISIMDEMNDQEKIRQNIEASGKEILMIIEANPHIDRQKYLEMTSSNNADNDNTTTLTDTEKQAFEEVQQKIIDLVLTRVISRYPMTKERFDEIESKISEVSELQKKYRTIKEADQ